MLKSFGEKATLGSDRSEKNVHLREMMERFTTGKMECKKGKTHVLHKLNISEILHFTRRCYDDTCKTKCKNIGITFTK